MPIDETRQDDAALAVDDLIGARAQVAPDRGNLPVPDQDVPVADVTPTSSPW